MSSQEEPDFSIDYDDVAKEKEGKRLIKKEYSKYHSRIDRSVNVIVHFSLWFVYVFIILLVVAFVYFAFRLTILQEDRISFLFQVISAFLAGSIGAGFGDKIFGGLRVFWDRWIDRQQPSSRK